MQNIRNTILSHLRLRVVHEQQPFTQRRNVFKQLYQQMCASSGSCPDEIMDRVIRLVKKFDKIDANKVTKTADFQRDLGLDSLDRVELVMAFEQEFSVEISDEKADKLTCCADIAKYIASGGEQKIPHT